MDYRNSYYKKTDPVKEYLNSGKINTRVAKILLLILVQGEVAFVGTVASGVCLIFDKYKRRHRFSDKQIHRAVYNLQRGKFINIVRYKNGRICINLTPKGKRKANEEVLHTLKTIKPARWDGKWCVLIFDIPVRFRNAREAFRFHVKRLGFKQLQKSVWVYPYPCEEELLFIAKFFGVINYIEILTVDRMLNSHDLKERFCLSGVKLQ